MSCWWAVALWCAACGDNRLQSSIADAGDDGPTAPAWCDDHNACTDDRVEDGVCRFVPAEDGRPCDDGDLCTLGDHCVAGQCMAGTRSSGPLAAEGTLSSLAGGGLGVVGDRYLVATGPPWNAHLQLAERRGADLAVVASWRGTLFDVYLNASDDLIVRTLSDGSAVIGGRGERSLAIFATPSLDERSVIALDGQLDAVTAVGSRIWACTRDFATGNEVELVDASDPDAPVLVGALSLQTPCGSIAASADGHRIYIGAADGVRYVDATPLDTGGNPTLADVFAPPAVVGSSPPYLLLRDPAGVHVVLESDHSAVTSITESGVLGVSRLGSTLVVEGWRDTAGGMEAFVALHDLQRGLRVDEVVLRRVSFHGDVGPGFSNALTGDGATLVTHLDQRAFDLSSGRLDELRVPALTPFSQLGLDGLSVRANGFASTAVVSVDDPTTPLVVGGGPYGRPSKFEPSLDETTPATRLLFGVRDGAPGQASIVSVEPSPLPAEWWHLDDAGHARVTGTFALPIRGPARVLVAGGSLYGMQGSTLEGWSLDGLGRAGELAAPAFSLTLPSTGAWIAFDVDARSGTAVVAIDSTLYWVDLAATPPAVVDTTMFDGAAREIRVAGSRAVISNGDDLISLERGTGFVSRATPPSEAFIEHLLAFDGRTIYYAAHFFAAGSPPDGLGAAAFGDPAEPPPPVALDDTAQMLIEASGALVVGLPGELVTVRPACE